MSTYDRGRLGPNPQDDDRFEQERTEAVDKIVEEATRQSTEAQYLQHLKEISNARDRLVEQLNVPIPMLIFCPRCGAQHIDKEETEAAFLQRCQKHCENEHKTGNITATILERWTNPPHRSHLCHACGTKFRFSKLYTVGVADMEPGTHDNWRAGHGIETSTV